MWWNYIAQYDKLPGTTLVNMALHEQAPNANYPYVVVTGIGYQTTRADRLPDAKDLDDLQSVDNRLIDVVAAVTPFIWAGTFTNDGQRLQYIYVKNPAGVESALQKFYATSCKNCKPYIHVKEDRNWEAYSDFLYPNQAVRNANKDELARLEHTATAIESAACTSRADVDDMFARIRATTKWDIDHDMVWGYFFVAGSEMPLSNLSARLKSDGYRVVDDMGLRAEGGQSWLHVEKVETHTVDSLNKRDHELCDLAAKFPNTKYDGMDVGPVNKKK